jgi:hypothetical protein
MPNDHETHLLMTPLVAAVAAPGDSDVAAILGRIVGAV